MKYILVKSIKSETQVSSKAGFYITDLMTVGMFFMSTFLLKDFILPELQIVFGIFNILVGLYLTAPSKTNKGKKNWQSIYIFLIANREFYYPLKNNSMIKKINTMLDKINEEGV